MFFVRSAHSSSDFLIGQYCARLPRMVYLGRYGVRLSSLTSWCSWECVRLQRYILGTDSIPCSSSSGEGIGTSASAAPAPASTFTPPLPPPGFGTLNLNSSRRSGFSSFTTCTLTPGATASPFPSPFPSFASKYFDVVVPAASTEVARGTTTPSAVTSCVVVAVVTVVTVASLVSRTAATPSRRSCCLARCLAALIAAFRAPIFSFSAATRVASASCHASALHSKLSDLPVPVGDSISAFCLF